VRGGGDREAEGLFELGGEDAGHFGVGVEPKRLGAGFATPDVNAAAVLEVEPAAAAEVAIDQADGVGVEAMLPGKLPDAGQAISRAELSTENA
jgi:hypothetical protein